jgi:hypothetical protein
VRSAPGLTRSSRALLESGRPSAGSVGAPPGTGSRSAGGASAGASRRTAASCLRPRAARQTEPRWIEDPAFDLTAHVQALAEPDEPVSYAAFAALRDRMLSEPLDRARPLWRIFLIPRLEDGRVGLLGKIHHALVDGSVELPLDRRQVAPHDGSQHRGRERDEHETRRRYRVGHGRHP